MLMIKEMLNLLLTNQYIVAEYADGSRDAEFVLTNEQIVADYADDNRGAEFAADKSVDCC